MDGAFCINVEDAEMAYKAGVGDGNFDDLEVIDLCSGSDLEGIFECVFGVDD
jgi:hypothetical protein